MFIYESFEQVIVSVYNADKHEAPDVEVVNDHVPIDAVS